MLVLRLVDIVLSFFYFIIDLFPDLDPVQIDLTHTMQLLAPILSIFPLDMFSFIIRNAMLWIGIHMLWAVIEWAYKKIPGVS